MNTLEMIDDILEHHGVKGMRWGVRKDKRWAKGIKKFEKNPFAIHNAVADRMNNGGIARFNRNNKHAAAMAKAKKAGNTKAFDAAFDRYLKDYEKAFDNEARSVIREKFGTSPSGEWRAELDTSNPSVYLIAIKKNVKHADIQENDFPDVVFRIIFDNNKKIVAIKPVSNSIGQTNLIDDILEHHGVKGMRWGVRRQRKDKQPLRTSTDYKRTQQFRKRHPSTLSNKQLKDLNERLTLERNFNTNNPDVVDKIDKGNKKVQKILGVGITATTAYTLATHPGTKKAISAGKKFTKKKMSG